MALPEDVTSCIVTGTFLAPDGSPLRGTVSFTPSVPLLDPGDSVMVWPVARTYELSGGSFTSAPLVSTDSSVIMPPGWWYTITISLQDSPGWQQYSIDAFLFAADSPLDISEITPVSPVMQMGAFLPITGGTMEGPLYAASAPTSANQVATMGWVESLTSGLSAKDAVRLATTAALPANTYANGAAGVGATLTANMTGSLTVDTVTPNLGDRILVKNETAQANNGIYELSQLGTSMEPYVLTRTTDMDTAPQIPGAYTFTEDGGANQGFGFIVSGVGPYALGTTAITWIQFTSTGDLAAGTGLSLSGDTVSLITPVVPAYGGTGGTVFSPMQYGAVGDGTTDDTTAVRDAVAAAVAVSGVIDLGTYTFLTSEPINITTGFHMKGAGTVPFVGAPGGYGGTIINSTTDLFTIASTASSVTFEGCNFTALSGGGHIWNAANGPSMSFWKILACRATQDNAGKAIWYQVGGGWLDCLVDQNCYFICSGSATVSPWSVLDTPGTFNSVQFKRMRCLAQGAPVPFFNIDPGYGAHTDTVTISTSTPTTVTDASAVAFDLTAGFYVYSSAYPGGRSKITAANSGSYTVATAATANYSGSALVGSEGWAEDIQFDSVTWEVCTGGAIWMTACADVLISLCAHWDTTATANIYQFTQSLTGYPCRNIQVKGGRCGLVTGGASHFYADSNSTNVLVDSFGQWGAAPVITSPAAQTTIINPGVSGSASPALALPSPLAVASGGSGSATAAGSPAYAAKAAATETIIYVSKASSASDSNDGLSWGSAKATIAGALTAIGSTGSGSTALTNPGIIQLGTGTWTDAATHTITGVFGFEIRGLGQDKTQITGPDAAAWILAVNCRRFKLANLNYLGSSSGTGWGFESQAYWVTGSPGAWYGGNNHGPTENGAENVIFGSSATPSCAYGIRHTIQNVDSDGNNDEGLYVNCKFLNCVQGVSIEHSNSLQHIFLNARFGGCGGCAVFQGGSATFTNPVIGGSTTAFGTGYMFDFQPPVGNFNGTSGTPSWQHDTDIIGLQSESNMAWVRSQTPSGSGTLRVKFTGGNIEGSGTAGSPSTAGYYVNWLAADSASYLIFTNMTLGESSTIPQVYASSTAAYLGMFCCTLQIDNYNWAGTVEQDHCLFQLGGVPSETIGVLKVDGLARGLSSAKPTAVSFGGGWYYATDNSALYYSNGVAWTQILEGTLPFATNVQWFTAGGTWSMGPEAIAVDVLLCGPGGGGGSGARGPSGDVICGGGAGAGGGMTRRQFSAAQLTSTVTVAIGSGGAGGAAASSDGSNGSNGSIGGSTSFGSYCLALAGQPGNGGTFGASSGTGAGGTATTATYAPASAGGTASTTGSTGGASANAAGPSGGGAGGGINAGPTAHTGGTAGYSVSGTAANTGAAGVIDTTQPTAGTSPATDGTPSCGGAGGCSSVTTTAQNGATAFFGGGGGGGGASLNGNASGAGGTGGTGFALVITYF